MQSDNLQAFNEISDDLAQQLSISIQELQQGLNPRAEHMAELRQVSSSLTKTVICSYLIEKHNIFIKYAEKCNKALFLTRWYCYRKVKLAYLDYLKFARHITTDSFKNSYN